MESELTISKSLVWIWVLWGIALTICVVGSVVVLVWGEDIWARAVGLALFGAEMLVVAGAALLSARLLLKRQTRAIDDRLSSEKPVRLRR